MIRSCIHTHSVFCDGKNTMAEMAAAGFQKGFSVFGFSGHTAAAGGDYGIPAEKISGYRAEAARLKALYDGRMSVLAGLEQDALTPDDYPLSGFDYIIGACHTLTGTDGSLYPVDESPELLRQNITAGFGGDAYAFSAAYYRQFADFLLRTKPTVAAHFDLLCKFNAAGEFFDENDPRYRSAALAALDAVLDAGIVPELNTGAVYRGCQKRPYPADFLLKRICGRKKLVVITTDAHSVDALDAFVPQAEELLRSIGFTDVLELTAGGFEKRPL